MLQAEIVADKRSPVLSSSSPTAKNLVRRWASVDEFVREVAEARIYEGIHYRTSVEVGSAMGRKIGALATEKYRPLAQ